MIPFLPKSRPAFHFLTVATFNSEAPAASPSHCPHAGLTSLQPTPLTTGPSRAPPPGGNAFSLRVRTASRTQRRRGESGGLSPK